MASLSIQSIDEQLAALLQQRAAAAKKSVSQFVLDTLRQHLGLEKAASQETAPEQRLTGVVAELAGLLKDKDVDESREVRTAHLEEKYR